MSNMRCPSCKKPNSLVPWEGPIEVMGVEVTTHGMRCDACGETLFPAEEIERDEREAADKIVARGIRTGAEFKFIRKSTGLRANELAEILDVRPETVSRWERGEVEVPRAVAYTLGEYYEHPRLTRRKLEVFTHQLEERSKSRASAI